MIFQIDELQCMQGKKFLADNPHRGFETLLQVVVQFIDRMMIISSSRYGDGDDKWFRDSRGWNIL